MELDRAKSKKRRAISGIIAAVILFAMLFTVGTSYFLFVNSNNLLYSKASVASANALQGRLSENVLLTASAPNNKIAFTVNNIGGLAVNVTAVYVTNSTGYILAFFKIGTPGITPTLPIAVNIGTVSSVINTGVSYTSGKNYVIKILTQRGSTFSTTYPPTATTLAAQALSSGAIGDLYLSLSTFTWYTVSSCGSNSCLNKQGLGFSIPVSQSVCNTCYTAFSVSVTNLNPSQFNITLDKYTQVLLFWGQGSSFRNQPWYIITNTSNTISSTYTPITLFYNKPVVLVFGSATAGSFTPQTLSGSNAPTSGTVASVFVVSHGWKNIALSKQTTGNANYGQNSPYVTILFY
jgi:flagellin-like protein